MEIRSGEIYDVGTDGLGFIRETAAKKVWAFHYSQAGASLVPTVEDLPQIEGRKVEFSEHNGKILSITLLETKAARG